MKTKSRAKSRIFEAVHETAGDLQTIDDYIKLPFSSIATGSTGRSGIAIS